jgi:hypothetical protein
MILYKLDNFEDFLTEIHADQYHGLDDDMPDDCGDWIANLDPEEFIDYADQYHVRQLQWYAKQAQKQFSYPPTK